jgi:hypothetical protein
MAVVKLKMMRTTELRAGARRSERQTHATVSLPMNPPSFSGYHVLGKGPAGKGASMFLIRPSGSLGAMWGLPAPRPLQGKRARTPPSGGSKSGQPAGGAILPWKLSLGEAKRVRPFAPRSAAVPARGVSEADKAARERILRAALPRLVRLARQYENLGLPFLALVQAASVGLLKAKRGFKPEEDARFSSRSARCIDQSIRQALACRVHTLRLAGYAETQHRTVETCGPDTNPRRGFKAAGKTA